MVTKVCRNHPEGLVGWAGEDRCWICGAEGEYDLIAATSGPNLAFCWGIDYDPMEELVWGMP